MENQKLKSITSNFQFTRNWIGISISLPNLCFQFISIWFFNIQQAFLNIICFIDLKEKLQILNILIIKCLNVKLFYDLKISKLNVLKAFNAIPNYKMYKWFYFEINIKLIKQKDFLSEIITIFMLYCKQANFVNSQRPIIHYTH